MSDFTITAGGVRLHWAALLLGAALLQWAIVATISLVSRAQRKLIVSTLILAVAYGVVFHAGSLLSKPHARVAAASALAATAAAGSCASVEAGMSAESVRTKLGKPNEVRSDEKARGPGAAIWVYRDSRCAVHMLDDRVELID